jgi:hypothetical protein
LDGGLERLQKFLVLLATELSLRPGSIQLGVFMPEATEKEGMGAKSKNDARSDLFNYHVTLTAQIR